MNNKIVLKLYLIAIALFLGSCVHEYPGEGGEPEMPVVNLSLDLDFNTEWSQFLTVEYSARASASDYDVRYQINAYPMIGGEYSATPSKHWTFTKDDISDLSSSFEIALKAGKYRIMVWTDYVDYTKADDKYYSTSDFRDISILGDYEGNNDFKDAFRGVLDIEVVDPNDPARTQVAAVVPMERPLAKFNIIASDVDEYTKDYMSRMKNQSKSEDAMIPAIEYNKYHAEVIYVGYLPCVFDMFQNKPIDSRTGAYFTSPLVVINEDEVQIGFDYVMVNGKESSVVIGVNIYDENNNLVSSVSNITVPLKRSKMTTVTGKFLTNGTSSGIGINPEFDGEFNIEIDG